MFFLAFLSVYFSFMLTVDEILSNLEDDNDMVDADIFMESPENAEARENEPFFPVHGQFFHFFATFQKTKSERS